MKQRLQKYIAAQGLASRREAEKMIQSGLIKVNGQKVPLGTQIDPEIDKITFKNKIKRLNIIN